MGLPKFGGLNIYSYLRKQNKEIKPNVTMKTYPLLQSQLGVFYDCLKYPHVMQYNIPCIVPLADDVDTDRVEKAVQTIYEARPELRIRFLK